MSGVAERMRVAESVVSAYLEAKEVVINKGYASEIDWQAERQPDRITEGDFMREAAWVVASSGFRESVVRKFYPKLSSVFGNWSSATWIVENRRRCRRDALRVFRSERKIDGILEFATRVHEIGFGSVKDNLRQEPIEFLRSFPFMGPATTYHLAKNLGLPVAKPDRHLVRIAMAAGCESPQHLCEEIAAIVGDGIAVVDIVMWRYATLNRDYVSMFQVKPSASRKQ